MMHDRVKSVFHDPETAERELDRVISNLDMRNRLRLAAGSHRDDSPWFVIRVRGSEKRLADEMQACGISAWCPQKKVLRRVPRQRAKYEGMQPLLPGYLLVSFDLCIHAILGVLSFDGVVCLLGNGDGPRAIMAKDIKDLAKRDQSAEPERRGLGMIFTPGETVEVVEGFLCGEEGQVSRGDDSNGVIEILLSAFGRMTPVKLGIDQVRKVR